MRKQISIIWHINDVHGRAEAKGYDLTDDQASEILEEIERQHDPENGITWKTIDEHIELFARARKLLRQQSLFF